MFEGFASGALSGALGIVGNFITNSQNAKIARMNNEFNAQQSLLQHQRNIELWNMNNAYNTPAAQMQRLKEAGLSPYLSYSNGAAGGTASQMTAPSAVRAESYHYQNPLSGLSELAGMLGSLQDLQIKKEQTKGLQIENNYKENQLVADVADKQARALSAHYKAMMDETNTTLLNKYGNDERYWALELLRNRAAASTHDKQLAEARLHLARHQANLAQRTLNYYDEYGYEGRLDYERALYGSGVPGAVNMGLGLLGSAVRGIASKTGGKWLKGVGEWFEDAGLRFGSRLLHP